MESNFSTLRPQGKSSLSFALKLFFVGMIAMAFAMPAVQAQRASFINAKTNVKDGAKTVDFARIDGQGQIFLDPTQPVQAVYEADMSHLGYKSQTAAQSFFNSFASQKAQYTAVSNTKVRVSLDLKQPGASAWSVTDWNSHFASEVANKSTSTK